MINPERVQKWDWLWIGDSWVEVQHAPWQHFIGGCQTAPALWMVGVMHVYEDGTPWFYSPVDLRAVITVMRNGIEIWNAADEPVQLTLFDVHQEDNSCL